MQTQQQNPPILPNHQNILTNSLQSQYKIIHVNNDQQLQWKSECLSLQKLLKEEHSLLWTENQQKLTFEKKLSETITAYYKNKIQSLSTRKNPFTKTKIKQNKIVSKFKQTFEIGDSNKNIDSKKNINSNKDDQQKILLQDEGFGDSCFYIKQILLSLSKDPQLMLTIIRKHQSIGYCQNLQSVVKSIVHSMYENIVDDDIYNKDLFFIINEAFKLIVASARNYTDIKLKTDKSIAAFILRQFLKKTEIINYSKQLIRNMVLQISKIDHQVSFNSEDQKGDKNSKQSSGSLGNLKLKKLQTMRNESPVKDQRINPKSKIQNFNSKITQYSQALQVKDEKMRLNRSQSVQEKQKVLRNRNKKCMSKQLLKYMGITEEIQFPTFVSSTANNQLKKQEEINKQWAAMLNQKQSHSQINPDIILIKNIVLIFFSDLFKMLYTLPLSLRIACKMFYQHLQKKFGSKKGCFYVIAEYVLGLCVMKNLQVEENPGEKSKVGNHVRNNIGTFSQIIMNIIRNDFKNIPRSFEYEFNLIVSNLRISLFNYMSEIINIDSAKISHIMSSESQKKDQSPLYPQAQKIKSYSVCVSISDIKRLFEMIKISKTQLMSINKNDKLIKRIQRIQMVTQGTDIFKQRQDKKTKVIYKPQNAYVMFYQLQMPKELNANFIKYHENYFKVDKFKKLMKSYLLSIKNLEYFPEFYKQPTLFEFFNQLSQKPKSYYEIQTMIENIDHVPIEIKIKYLVSLIKNTYTQNQYGQKLYQLVSVMYKQVVQRMQYYKTIWDQSKESYLKALSSVIYLNQIIINTENIITKNIKNKKLDQFIAKTKIAVCLTSPKTRQKDIVSKTNIVKDLAQDQKSKIWLENQSRCIHTALNLQFIKNLTGEPEKMKKQDSHCNNIMKFADVLCSLPEIKQNTAEDIGVKQTFFQFIKYCSDLVLKNQQYASFSQDVSWLQESFQQKLSKKIYDRLYPKDPSYEDVAFYLRLKTLDFITYSHLKIKPCLRNDKMWQLAGKQLRMMDKVKTASQKLNCINECSKIIVNSYHLINDSDDPASAEDIYPLIVYVLIKAAPKRMISNMTFIQYFACQNRLMSKQGYAYTQLKSAIQFCDFLTEDNLQFENMTPAQKTVEFRKTIYEKEIQYGIYFLLLRKNTSHQVDCKNIKFLKDFFSNLTVQN